MSDSGIFLWPLPLATRWTEHVIRNDDGACRASGLLFDGKSGPFSSVQHYFSMLAERTELIVSKSQGVMAAATGLAVALLAFVASAQNAPQQGNPAGAPPGPDATRPAPMQAPVGHRQPRASDVPTAPARDDVKAAAGARDDIDDKLRICRGC